MALLFLNPWLFFLAGYIAIIFVLFLAFLELSVIVMEFLDKYVVKKVRSWIIRRFYQNKDL